MEVLVSLLIIVAVAAVAIWLIKLIPFPPGLAILQTVLICIVVVLALLRVVPML